MSCQKPVGRYAKTERHRLFVSRCAAPLLFVSSFARVECDGPPKPIDEPKQAATEENDKPGGSHLPAGMCKGNKAHHNKDSSSCGQVQDRIMANHMTNRKGRHVLNLPTTSPSHIAIASLRFFQLSQDRMPSRQPSSAQRGRTSHPLNPDLRSYKAGYF